MARDWLTSWKTITAPVTRPSRLWMGAAESSIGGLEPVAADQHAVRGQAHGPVLLHGALRRIRGGLACRAVDDPEYFCKRSAQRVLTGPAGHRLRHQIQIGHVAQEVGGQHGVTDGVERDLGALLFLEQGLFRRSQPELRCFARR